MLRPVTEDDCRRVWDWSNDPVTRAASFEQATIPWDHHVAWFEKRLHDRATVFLIAEVEDVPVAQVRYKIDGDLATVSVSTDPAARRKGYATQALRAGSDWMFATTGVSAIHAYVKPGNDASRDLFVRAGYVELEPAEVAGQVALHLIQVRQ